MLYSVWNPTTRRYDYYQALGGTPPTHAGAPRHVPGSATMGATPEEAAWPLPMGAKKIGAGPTARGRVAKAGGLPGMAGWEFMNVPGYVVAALIATTFWYLGRRGR